MIRAHLAAVVGLLTTGLPSTTGVHVGEVGSALEATDPAPPESTPYVVVRTDTMPVTSDRLAQWSQRLDARFYVSCVGQTVREAQWAQEKTRALLLDVVPVVAGRTCGPLTGGDSSPVAIDRDVTPSLFVAVDVYRLLTLPAPA